MSSVPDDDAKTLEDERKALKTLKMTNTHITNNVRYLFNSQIIKKHSHLVAILSNPIIHIEHLRDQIFGS